MKQYNSIITSLICMMLISACSGFLEEKSQDEVLVRTVQDYDELLLGYMHNSNGYLMLYALDDDIGINEAKLGTGTTENGVILDYSGCLTWQPNMWEQENKIDDGYQYTYDNIKGLNAVLDGIDEVHGSQQEKELIKAGALGMRGFCYYMLVNLFGEPYNYNKKALGVPLKLTAGLTENGIPRNTVEEVYTQILKDLNTSATLFEKYPKETANYKLNVTVVNILLSRVYLHMEQWEDVIRTANKAIETAKGLTDYTQISADAKYYLPSYDLSEVEWVYAKNAIVRPLGPSAYLLSKYKEGDRRLDLWFSANRADVTKKIPETPTTDPTSTIRISEAYLNRAEAYAQSQGYAKEALADLNQLRRYRIVGYQDVTITDSKTLLEEIRLERRLELCYEGHRWFDLRRYGMPSISHDYKTRIVDPWITYTLQEKDPLYTLPIPEKMISNNTRLEQNASAYEPERTGVLKNQ